MGIENDTILSYLEDNARFADLFNQFCFGGREIVDPRKLTEASEVYHMPPDRRRQKKRQGIRDIKKRLDSGVCLKILAVEAQNDVNYIMPWRIMEYDCMEYGKQIRRIQNANKEAGEYADAGERLCGFRREDRLVPVYTLCLYHGAERWDGPRCLKDMADFGAGDPGWEQCFSDYPMRLICANEPMDCTAFRTSLGVLFELLPLRGDKARLKKLMDENPIYQKLDEDTAETAGILMGVNIFMKQKKKYKNEEGYNMCQAIREMMEDSRTEGWEAGEKNGLEAGIRIFVQSNRDDGLGDAAIADKLGKYFGLAQKEALKFL